MADVVTPYLSRPTFEGMFRPLSTEEGTLADLLLKAATVWINDRIAEAGRPALAVDDPMAILVSYQVTRNALPAVPEMTGRTQYTITTDERTESGTIAAAMGILDFDDNMRMLLGLSASPSPSYGGMDGNFGDIQRDVALYDAFGSKVDRVVVGDFP